jgi:hypothetical protein
MAAASARLPVAAPTAIARQPWSSTRRNRPTFAARIPRIERPRSAAAFPKPVVDGTTVQLLTEV